MGAWLTKLSYYTRPFFFSERTYADAATLFAALACVPSRKPFLKRRGMCLMWRMRPVPFVRLRSAFSDQLNRRSLAPG